MAERQTETQIEKICCPYLNEFRTYRGRDNLTGAMGNREIILKFENGSPTGIICSEYIGKGRCKVYSDNQNPNNITECIYSQGFQDFY